MNFTYFFFFAFLGSCHFIPSTFLKMFCALNKYLFFRVIEEVVA